MTPQLSSSSSRVGSVKINKPRKRSIVRPIILTLLIAGIAGLSIGFVKLEKDRREVRDRLQDAERQLQQMRANSQKSPEEFAMSILEKARQHIEIPDDPQPEILTVTDAEQLRKDNEGNPFYQNVANGDHLIISGDWAVFYNAERDRIYSAASVIKTSPNPENNAMESNDQSSMENIEPSPTASSTPSASPFVSQ